MGRVVQDDKLSHKTTMNNALLVQIHRKGKKYT